MLNHLRVSLVVISTLLPLALLGCQINSLNHSAQTSTVIDDKNWSATTLESRLFQTTTKYKWQLTHVSDDNSRIKPFNQKLPLIMEVHPSLLTFTEGCQRHQVSFDMWLPLPYLYGQINIRKLSDNCTTVNHSIIENLSNKNTIKNKTGNVVNGVFISYSDTAFRFDPVLPNSAQSSNKTLKQLALKTNKGKTLIFSGTPKPEYPAAGIPLTNELLERYQWRLISANDDTNKTINKFNRPDVPITANYRLGSHDYSNPQQSSFSQGIGFSVGCNGAGRSYALSTNQTLLIGGNPSTMVGCGDDIESSLSRLMLYSSSQLTLNNLDKQRISNPSNNSDNSESSYILTQKLESGETLVWQN
jgi:hypothetical protein